MTKVDQLYTHVVDQIERGELRPGDKLPSTTQLRREHHVSFTVVYQAVMLLAHDGWITSEAGRGRYVADPLPE